MVISVSYMREISFKNKTHKLQLSFIEICLFITKIWIDTTFGSSTRGCQTTSRLQEVSAPSQEIVQQITSLKQQLVIFTFGPNSNLHGWKIKPTQMCQNLQFFKRPLEADSRSSRPEAPRKAKYDWDMNASTYSTYSITVSVFLGALFIFFLDQMKHYFHKKSYRQRLILSLYTSCSCVNPLILSSTPGKLFGSCEWTSCRRES